MTKAIKTTSGEVITIHQHPKYKYYHATEDGRVFKVQEIKPQMNRNGYHRITTEDKRRINGSRTYAMIAKMVWESIQGKMVPDGMEINHKDKVRTNNCLSNLELVTRQDNIKHRDGKDYEAF